jgi:DNA-binding transcriptional LysR family regulator
MEISQIKYFLALAETLNFTEAARRCGIAQPSLTKAIQRLEDELGSAVIYRDGKDTRLTALGRDLQVEFMKVEALFGDITNLAENSVLGRSRRVFVGIASTIAPRSFAPFWRHVLDQLPSVELQLHALLPGEGETEVLSGKYDLCILPSPPKPNFKLVTHTLFNEPLLLAMSAKNPLAKVSVVSTEKLMAEPYIDRLHCEFRSQLILHFMDRGIVMRPRVQSEREDWSQEIVAAGAGVCALPARSAIVERLVLRPVEGLDLSRDVTLVAVSGSGNLREVRRIFTMAQSFDWSI